MVGPPSSSMTPDLIASSRVRYSLTDTLSLAARSVKKKLMSMGGSPPGAGLPSRIHARARRRRCPRGDNGPHAGPVDHRDRLPHGRVPAGGDGAGLDRGRSARAGGAPGPAALVRAAGP